MLILTQPKVPPVVSSGHAPVGEDFRAQPHSRLGGRLVLSAREPTTTDRIDGGGGWPTGGGGAAPAGGSICRGVPPWPRRIETTGNRRGSNSADSAASGPGPIHSAAGPGGTVH